MKHMWETLPGCKTCPKHTYSITYPVQCDIIMFYKQGGDYDSVLRPSLGKFRPSVFRPRPWTEFSRPRTEFPPARKSDSVPSPS